MAKNLRNVFATLCSCSSSAHWSHD